MRCVKLRGYDTYYRATPCVKEEKKDDLTHIIDPPRVLKKKKKMI